ncbi:hypothetical protein COY93_03635 [Candidatus Uhrbacteria bacterium CG_4_10_14_0_8_um_filter_58_22]|uniref:Uncharacterized protein n=1 Tax=Candidatus Uhrbacteria bacterium CG_4_10_14_0_8_um_filter_58_22 TaxID=1975029 RepID=A0A2M7QA79_9BACT|nr:MAG: hypothetical protein AUJ19_02610 [Parcubacteria group bacterium CG1_02_58_44]PIY62181.1 MAG: hypothetical protein COY93_03635 [Candidatus Uhrbacteria bacterium CG_4_10_14_0_8_um_filter_58_22]
MIEILKKRTVLTRAAATLPVFIIVLVGLLAVFGLPHVTWATTLNDPAFAPLGNFQREGRDFGIQIIIGRIIRGAVAVSGVIALAMFVWSGFNWMLAQGNKEAITKAQNTLLWSTLGLILIFGAYTLVSFVLGALGQ